MHDKPKHVRGKSPKRVDLRCGDNIEVLRTLADNSIDSCVTDPPYGLSFMGKKWDYDVPSIELWAEVLRVLKPGGYLLAFAGTRTQHRMTVRIEDAGFEIRDMIAWVYGSGFPKSLDVSKAMDKAAGAEREVCGEGSAFGRGSMRNKSRVEQGYRPTEINPDGGTTSITAPATDAAKQWDGWGTALKPALEPITMARKPLQSTVAANVLEHGTGAINIDGCRIDADISEMEGRSGRSTPNNVWGAGVGHDKTWEPTALGRWPANLIHDGSPEVLAAFPATTSGALSPHHRLQASDNTSMSGPNQARSPRQEFGNDSGSAARFFYCAKAARAERENGLTMKSGRKAGVRSANIHPTVKPLALMRYLVKMVTRKGAIVLDPFMGSGTTGWAARLEGCAFIGIDRDPEYVKIAAARIAGPGYATPVADVPVADVKAVPLQGSLGLHDVDGNE